METRRRGRKTQIEADIVVYDANEDPVLLVMVKYVTPVPESADQLVSYLKGADIPFGMLVDPDNLRVFRSEGEPPSVPILTLKTEDVLGPYQPDLGGMPSFGISLEAPASAWLRDLAIHWKLKVPPASEEMAKIGLLTLLKGSTLMRGVPIDCYHLPLRRTS